MLDLKPEEFTVTEDNKPQKVEQFSVVKIDAIEQNNARPTTAIRSPFDEEREAARPDVRLFVLLLDDYHVRRGNDMAVRKPLAEFIANQLDPADMLAIMYPLTPVADIHFSRDRNAAIGAINNFEGRKFNYQPRNAFEEQYAYYPAATVERVRNQVTMGALKAAAVRLGGLREGRKAVIFVSEGFTATLPAQLNDPVAAMPGVGNPVGRRPTPQTPTTDMARQRADFMNQTDMLTDMRDVFDTANRQNTSIYAVDPRGLAAVEYGINEGVNQTIDRDHLNSSLDTLRTPGGEHRRPRHHQPQRPRRRDEADHPRLERLLPARLQLDAGADRRQVPRDQGARQPARRRGAGAQGVLGAVARGRGAGERAAEARSAGGRDRCAELARRTGARPSREVLGRHVARRQRPDPRDVQLGSDRAAAGIDRADRAGGPDRA